MPEGCLDRHGHPPDLGGCALGLVFKPKFIASVLPKQDTPKNAVVYADFPKDSHLGIHPSKVHLAQRPIETRRIPWALAS